MAILERNANLNIWWFPKEFSQSRFGEFHHSGSNSCTLISLILADMVAKEGRGFHRHRSVELPPRAVDILAEAINKGNSAYGRVSGQLSTRSSSIQLSANQNLNIPDALNVLKDHPNFRIKEWFFTHMQADPERESGRTISLRLMQSLNMGVDLFRTAAIPNEHFLFAALIADNRTVLFIIEFPANIITFFDSHQHGRDAGAVIAQCSYRDVFEMMNWFVNMNHDVYSSQPTIYEVSFLTPNPKLLPTPDKPEKLQVVQGTPFAKSTSKFHSKH